MEAKENRNYRDSVFKMLFNDLALIPELYRDITRHEVKDKSSAKIITLSDTLYKNRINDLGFTIDDKLLVLVEQQSTYNPNMSLRMLLYVAREYESLLDNKFIYRSTLQQIPTPEFYVLYFGRPEDPCLAEMKLSDAYKVPDGGQNYYLELKVKQFNLNSSEFVNRLSPNSTLYQYIYAINKLASAETKEKRQEYLERLIQEDVLREFFTAHSKEVINVLNFAFDKDTFGEVKKEEGHAEGLAKGELIGEDRAKKEFIANLLADKTPLSKIAKLVGLPLSKVEEIAKTIS